MDIRFLQVNVGRSRAAHDLALSTAKKLRIDVVIMSEPNVAKTNGQNCIADRNKNVAIFVTTSLEVTEISISTRNVTVKFCGLCLTACYLSPNIPWELYHRTVG